MSAAADTPTAHGRSPNQRDTRFRIASVGKTHTAVAVLQLVERGLLSLDTSIIELLGLEDTQISNRVTILPPAHHDLWHSRLDRRVSRK